MRKTRHTQQSIIAALKEVEAGARVEDVCRKLGVAQTTFYRWKAKYGGMETSDAKRLKALEDENARLKRMVAQAGLESAGAPGRRPKKMVKPTAMRRAVGYVREVHGLSERAACRALGFNRSSHQYRARRQQPEGLVERLKHHAQARPRFGYRRLHQLLRREGHQVNHKRVHRLYRGEGLLVRRRARRKLVGAAKRVVLEAPTRCNQRWSMDFTLDALVNGRAIRTLNVVDDFSRECLALEVDTSISGFRVARVLDALIAERGEKPQLIVMDNGPEFTSKALDAWSWRTGVKLHFIRPGKPVENAYVESFNGRFPGRMPQHEPVSGLGGRACDNGRVAQGLQRGPAPQLARRSHAS